LNAKAILDEVVIKLRAIPAKMSGEDSPLADPWEEIKEQVQHGLSIWWQDYLETMNRIVVTTVILLSESDCKSLATELALPSTDSQQLAQAVIRRLLERAKRERIQYAPFDFTYFWYPLADMIVYAKVLERTGPLTCCVMAYSIAAPFGEAGEVDINLMADTMTSEEFDLASQQGWPDRVKRTGNRAEEESISVYEEVAKEASIPIDEAVLASDALLRALHKRFAEFRGVYGHRDYLGEKAYFELSEKGFYHLLGLLEQFSQRYPSWKLGDASEYLGRLPPVERWKKLTEEVQEWDW